MHLAPRARRHGDDRRDGGFPHGRLAVLERLDDHGHGLPGAQRHVPALDLVAHVAERGFEDAQGLLARPPVFVSPRGGLGAEDGVGGRRAVAHQREHQAPPRVPDDGLLVAEAVERAREEARDVRAERLRLGRDREGRGAERAGAHLRVAVLQRFADGVGQARRVRAVGDARPLEKRLSEGGRGEGGGGVRGGQRRERSARGGDGERAGGETPRRSRARPGGRRRPGWRVGLKRARGAGRARGDAPRGRPPRTCAI